MQYGSHTITADADVDCWYCKQGTAHFSLSTNFCITWPATQGVVTRVPFAKSDSLSWSELIGDKTVHVAADTTSLFTKWDLIKIGGISTQQGLIRSTESACLCMRSVDTGYRTPIGLAFCNATDTTQQWKAALVPTVDSKSFWRFENLAHANQCLSEAVQIPLPLGPLIQSECLDSDNQVWAIMNPQNGMFVSPF